MTNSLNAKTNQIIKYGNLPKLLEHPSWKLCVGELEKLNSASTPREIIACFFGFQEAVYRSFIISCDKIEISADDKLHMFTFLFVKAEVGCLHR